MNYSHVGYYCLSPNSFPFNASNGNATDQNAWIQSGNSIDKPFTDMGITGKGYTVGYADSGEFKSKLHY